MVHIWEPLPVMTNATSSSQQTCGWRLNNTHPFPCWLLDTTPDRNTKLITLDVPVKLLISKLRALNFANGETKYISWLFFFPCGGGLEYLHRSPASRRRRWKGNPVPGGVTGPPCHWGTYIQRPGPPCWGLHARLTTFLCKKNYCCEIQRSANRIKSDRIF
jgi:hypothetical protein